jgi:tetratricopeptide (TPR) repeat protein
VNHLTLVAWSLVLLSPATILAEAGDWTTRVAAAKKASERGKYQEAEQHAAAALQQAREFGAGEQAIAACLIQQAEVALRQGQFGRTNDLAGRAQLLLEKLHGPEHPDVAHCLELRADAYCAVGFPNVAFKLARQSGVIRQKAFGDKNLELARSLETLNRIYHAQGIYGVGAGEEDEERWRSEAAPRALAIRRALLGDDHPGLIPALLSQPYSNKDRKPLLRQAEALIRKYYGEQHPLLADWLQEQGRVELYNEDYQAAEKHLLSSLEISKKTLGPGHTSTYPTLELLSQVYRHQGHFPRADSVLLDSIRCRFRGLSDTELCWFFQIAARLRDTFNPLQDAPSIYEVYLTEMVARRGAAIEACLQMHYDELSGRFGRAILFNHVRDFLEDVPFLSLKNLPRARDDFKSMEVLTALRRVQGRPDPVQIVVREPLVQESHFPDLPVFNASLRNVDSLGQPSGFTEGGDYRSGRLTRWRFQVQDSRGVPLPILNSNSGEGGRFERTSLHRGEEWATMLSMSDYVAVPGPGEYKVRILYHDSRELMCFQLLAGRITCQSPEIRLKVSPRIIEVSAEERTRVKKWLKSLNPKGPVKVVAGAYGPWAHKFLDPTSPAGQILTPSWKSAAVLFEELPREDLPAKQRAWILALLFSITGANDPRDDPSVVLGDYESHERPRVISGGRPGQPPSGGSSWSEPWSVKGTIDPNKQKAFARCWNGWKNYLVIKQPGQEPKQEP